MFNFRKKIGCKNTKPIIDLKKCKIHSLNNYIFTILNKMLYIKFYIDDIKYKLKINLYSNIELQFNKDDNTIIFYYNGNIWNYNTKSSKKINTYFQFNFSNDKIGFYKIYSRVIPIQKKYRKKKNYNI